MLPRPHGSALFTRGQTQILSVVTLGTEADAQQIDGIGLEEKKRYIHHYNFPPYSVGETPPDARPRPPRDRPRGARRAGPAGSAARRGRVPLHGPHCLGNHGVERLNLDGQHLRQHPGPDGRGVPIKAPAAGRGDGPDHVDLGRRQVPRPSDIQGIEDALGDMDFKVPGTEKGVTALQMDIKVRGITTQVMQDALGQAREGRMWIMGKMMEAISEPRTELSEFALRMTKIQINPDRIRDVIARVER